MNLSEKLLKDFGKLLKTDKQDGSHSADKTIYGTVTKKTDDKCFVQLDGSDTETPVSYTTDAEVGDRVTVLLKDHKAVITGNISAPVNARAADKYMRFSEEGLRIGIMGSNGRPTGYSILIDGTAYYIKDANDVTVAKFGANIVDLLSGSGSMSVVNQILYLIGLKGSGIRAADSSVTRYRSEVVAKCDPTATDWNTDTNPAVSLQLLYDNRAVHSLLVNNNGIFGDNVPLGKVYEQQYLLTKSTVITTLTSVSVIITLDEPPTGYRWEGISGILIDLGKYVESTPGQGQTVWNNNYYHDDNKYITINSASLYQSTRRVYVAFSSNASNYQYVRLLLICYALPFAGVNTGETKYISF